MMEPSEETKPNHIIEETSPVKPAAQKPRRGLWIFLSILILLVGAGIGGGLGYQKGVQNRLDAQKAQVVAYTTQQYELGLQDMRNGNMDVAYQRFMAVFEMDPTFPGVKEKLVEVDVARKTVATPTPQPTPTVMPTPDTRGEQELFSSIQQNLRDKAWDQAIINIEALRTLNIQYQAVALDGMYYIALRYRGVDRILINGMLEQGIYDLTLAERFAPIDKEAESYREWARMYLNGASFWAVDWTRVINYFGQIYPAFPNLRDGSGITAVERYRLALVGYGDQLVREGKYCEAKAQYEAAMAFSPRPEIQPTLDEAARLCENPNPTGDATQEVTPSPPGDSTGTPTLESPTVEPTAETTPEPSVTVTP